MRGPREEKKGKGREEGDMRRRKVKGEVKLEEEER